jgi:hypothetical protein
MFCSFCSRPCGERQFCDEVCYDEYQHDLAEFQASIADELPVGESRFDCFDEPPVFDGDF